MMTNFADYPLAAGTWLLAGQARVVRGENLILDSTKDKFKFGLLELMVGHTAVSKTVRTESKPRHLSALWKRRQKAFAGSTPSAKRDYTQNSCEFIHCKCCICVSFKNSVGGWCSVPYRCCVGCKCVRCRPFFSATGHWDADIARKRGSVGQFYMLSVQSPV